MNNKTIRFIEEDKFKILNLSSLSEKGDRLFNLLPPFPAELYDADKEKAFDLAYAEYIMANDKAFMDLMKIIYPEYENSADNIIIYIMVDFDDMRMAITESLIKFIQQRYGIICNIINKEDDWDYIEGSDFNIIGLGNLDADKERYSILEKANNSD